MWLDVAPVNKLVPATSLLWALYKSRVLRYLGPAKGEQSINIRFITAKTAAETVSLSEQIIGRTEKYM